MVPLASNGTDHVTGWLDVVVTRTSAQNPDPQSLDTVGVNVTPPGAGVLLTDPLGLGLVEEVAVGAGGVAVAGWLWLAEAVGLGCRSPGGVAGGAARSTPLPSRATSLQE